VFLKWNCIAQMWTFYRGAMNVSVITRAILGIQANLSGFCLWFVGLWACQYTVCPNTFEIIDTRSFSLSCWTGQVICSRLSNNTIFQINCACHSVAGFKAAKLLYITVRFNKTETGWKYCSTLHFQFKIFPRNVCSGNMYWKDAFCLSSELLNLNYL
jgi:hypothetical protein